MDGASETAPSGQAARAIFPARWGLAVPALVIDTREQCPLNLDGWPGGTVRAALPVGDYGLQGFSDWDAPRFIAERKSTNDLIGSLTSDRPRFLREVHKLRQFGFRALVIEGTPADVEARCREAHPVSVLQSCYALQVRFGLHVLWCGNPEGAAQAVQSLARQFLRGLRRDLERCPRVAKGGVECY